MQLRDKINFVKSSVFVGAHDYEDRDKFMTTLNQIQGYVDWRNIVAHQSFAADDKGDGVRFFIFKAKGKISIPDVRWSVDDFGEKFAMIKAASRELEIIQKSFKRSRLVNALLQGGPAPTQGIDETSLPDRLLRQSLEDHTSDSYPSNHQTNEQTPPSSEE